MPTKSTTKNRYFKLKSCLTEFMSYSTERSATIKSYKVGSVYRIVQLLILTYIIGYELIHNRAYQVFDHVSSSVTTKVKGQGFVPTNSTFDHNLAKYSDDIDYYHKLYTLNPNLKYYMLDTADYVIPPNEYNSVFIMTNFIKTEQKQDFCGEEISKYKAKCKTDDDCKILGSFINTWNGIPTGRCINSTLVPNAKVCEVSSWCPAENEDIRNEDLLIRNVLNFTIFIKNDIEFKRFKKKLRNILPHHNNFYLQTCHYHEKDDPYCPVFKVNDILSSAEPDEKEMYHMLIKGGLVLIEIIWNCNFDFNQNCLPVYSFRRFDTKETTTASGFNFRFANKFREKDTEYRVLYKAYGLRFIINVSGTAGKFNIVPLMLTIGAGIGLMSISVIIADCVLLNCTKKKKFYQEIKELDVNKVIDSNIDVVRL